MNRILRVLLCLILLTLAGSMHAHAGIWDDIKSAASDALDWAEGAVDDAAGWAEGAVNDAVDWTKGAVNDAVDWTAGAANDVWNWGTGAATDAYTWGTGAVNDAWIWSKNAAISAYNWTSDAAVDSWDAISGFFDPPSTTEGTPNIAPEPELPAGTQKMYLGYVAKRTENNSGYSGSKSIEVDDPHYGLTMGKFYVSGFSRVLMNEDKTFVFLKNVGDDVKLHFELVQDIDMIGGDSFVTIAQDDGGFDKYFEIKPTYFGRGTLIVRHIDYQNNAGDPQVYTDYLSAKASGTADTVISLNEEGDYEVALDYKINTKSRKLGVDIKFNDNYDYRIYFHFSVRNGNCMIFPFDVSTGDELQNASFTPNGFYLDFAYSHYLNTNVCYSVLTEGPLGIMEDVRFNRPAQDGAEYTQEGIYTITVMNQYTGEQTSKRIYVGSDERLIEYMTQGLTTAQMIDALNNQ